MAKNLKFAYNANKEDMFALALVLIELGTQESLQDVYGKGGKFDHEAMRAHVAKFEGIYAGPENQLLVTSVLTMLEPEEARRPHFILLHERMPSYYSVVKHFESLRDNPGNVTASPLEAFIYIDKAIIEGFTLTPGVTQVKSSETPAEIGENMQLNPAYSRRNIEAPAKPQGSYTGTGKVVERIIRRFEERDGAMVERVEHFNVDGDKLTKTEEYELVGGKKTKVKYFDESGAEILGEEPKAENIKKEGVADKKQADAPKVKERSDKKKNSINGGRNKSIDKHKRNSFSKVKDLTADERKGSSGKKDEVDDEQRVYNILKQNNENAELPPEGEKKEVETQLDD